MNVIFVRFLRRLKLVFDAILLAVLRVRIIEIMPPGVAEQFGRGVTILISLKSTVKEA